MWQEPCVGVDWIRLYDVAGAHDMSGGPVWVQLKGFNPMGSIKFWFNLWTTCCGQTPPGEVAENTFDFCLLICCTGSWVWTSIFADIYFKGDRKECINRNANFVIFALRLQPKNIIVPGYFSAKERRKSRGLRLTFQAQICKKYS